MWGEDVEMGPARTDVKWAIDRRKTHQHIRFIPMNFLLEKVSMAAKCSRMFQSAAMEMFIRRRRKAASVWVLCVGLQRTLMVVVIMASRIFDPFIALSRSEGRDGLGNFEQACATTLWTGERERICRPVARKRPAARRREIN